MFGVWLTGDSIFAVDVEYEVVKNEWMKMNLKNWLEDKAWTGEKQLLIWPRCAI